MIFKDTKISRIFFTKRIYNSVYDIVDATICNLITESVIWRIWHSVYLPVYIPIRNAIEEYYDE